MVKVFFSHSSKDKELATRIALDLQTNEVGVWLDEWEIRPGHSITQKIQEGLKQCEFVAVLLTKHSVGSGWVEKEWQSKIGEEANKKRVIILPLKGEDCEIPHLLIDRKYADFAMDYRSAMNELLGAIKAFDSNNRDVHVVNKLLPERQRLFHEFYNKFEKLEVILRSFSNRLSYEAFVQTLEEIGVALEEQRLTLSIFGRIKAGKSTLLNALVGHEISPTNVNRATTVPIKVYYGGKQECRVSRTEGGFDAKALRELGQWMRRAPESELNRVKEVLITTDAPILGYERELRLLDTAGLGGRSGARPCLDS